jgi:DNA-binding protein
LFRGETIGIAVQVAELLGFRALDVDVDQIDVDGPSLKARQAQDQKEYKSFD